MASNPEQNDICQLLLTWLERGKGAYSHEIIAFAAKVVKYNPYALPEAPKVRSRPSDSSCVLPNWTRHLLTVCVVCVACVVCIVCVSS
jgi:hypothetical protein